MENNQSLYDKKQNLLNKIYALDSDIKSLTSQIDRLMDVYNDFKDLYPEIEQYRDRVRDHVSSINSIGTVCDWEGQTVKDFKEKYIAADAILYDDIIPQYRMIIENLCAKIGDLTSSAQRKITAQENARKELYALTNS